MSKKHSNIPTEAKDIESLKAVGFTFNDNEQISGINGNVFARYILTLYTLLFSPGSRFYQYRKGRWEYVENIVLSKRLRKKLHEFVPDFWTTVVEKTYIEALKREAPYVTKLDADRDSLNLSNGMLNLDSFKLTKHRAKYHSSIQIPIIYDKILDCPHFKNFLADVFEEDAERIAVVQEMLGYCLTSDTSAQKCFFLFGKGANGKSILAEIMLNLCGKENVSAIPIKDLSKPFSRYELVDKLLNLATENEVSEKGLNTTHFKAIVAGDPIQVEKKHEQSFTYQPVCKLVFSLNNLPYTKDRSLGFQRRLIVIPFNKTFREDDPMTKNYNELLDSLLAELSGILNFALEGLKRLRKNKYRFSHSTAIDNALKKYRELINPHLLFVSDAVEQGDQHDRLYNDDLVRTFKTWCENNGYLELRKRSNRAILADIRDVLLNERFDFDHGDHCKSGKKGRYTHKVKLKVQSSRTGLMLSRKR
ncbi:MAG TPA: phage/plasmid primase, P4 family [Oscillospiraceae bacterium]|nr:phage/plasmid primase, P4 family [Oscillospiraceae bacterium]